MSKTRNEIYNKKIAIDNYLSKKLAMLHVKVLKENAVSKQIDLTKYEHLYYSVLKNANARIGLVRNQKLYNELFLQDSLTQLLYSLQRYLLKKKIKVKESYFYKFDSTPVQEELIATAAGGMVYKAMQDTTYFTQVNYERQNYISSINENEESLSEEEIMSAIVANEVLKTKTRKIWNTRGDDRVRAAHNHMQGRSVNVNHSFTLNGYKFFYPGDSSSGAPAQLWINCRCFLTYKNN